MRKSVIPLSKASTVAPSSDGWLDLQQIASAEISSEDPQHPFENALRGERGGWRAADPGPQVIRLNFDEPQSIRRIRLEFREQHRERAQEFAVFASSASYPRREIVRQQWTFSPGGSATEVEDYSVDLPAVLSLVLEIDPGRHDKLVVATLESISVA
jgi:hypothetical protein